MPISIDDLPLRQKDVVCLILELTREHGYPPTLAELATGLGLKNRMTVHQHVVALKKKGIVQWEPGLNRSLRVLNNVEIDSEFAKNKSNSDKIVKFERSQVEIAKANTGIPLAGKIAAGYPIEAISTDERLTIDKQYSDTGCYALKVKGDSMLEEGIFDGDYVIVKPEPAPRNGELVVALLGDGNATLKRFYKENNKFRLQPANKDYQPIYVGSNEDLQIQGIVVGLYRRF